MFAIVVMDAITTLKSVGTRAPLAGFATLEVISPKLAGNGSNLARSIERVMARNFRTASMQASKSTKPSHQTNRVEEDDEVRMIYTLTDKQNAPKVTGEVAGALVTMDVDTGASMTVIPAYIYKRFLTRVKLQKSRVKLQTYSELPTRNTENA